MSENLKNDCMKLKFGMQANSRAPISKNIGFKGLQTIVGPELPGMSKKLKNNRIKLKFGR